MIFAAIVGIISPFVIRGGACALSDVSPQLSAALPWAPAPVLIAAHRFLYDTSALFSFGCFLLLLSAFIANLGGMFITNMEGITNANKLPKARIKGALEKEFPVLQFMVHKVAITAHMVYRLWLIGGGGPVRVLTGALHC